MALTFDPIWAYVAIALMFHAYVAWKVRRIAAIFETDEGLQDFSDRIMRAWVFSALTIPAQLFKMLGQMKQVAAEKAQQQATEMAAEAAERVAVTLTKKE